MIGKSLDCVGTETGVGKHDFQPSGPIIHGEPAADFALKRRTAESQRRYYEEKIAELVLTQSQLAKSNAERDALARELREIKRIAQTYNQPDRKDLWKWLNEICDIAAKVLAKLASGELRKLKA
jgi:hypothetical protein